MKRIFTASNDAGLLQIVSGQADWTHNFVPNVESAYMAKDPKNYHNAYLVTALAHSLTFNTTQYPYSIAAFRKGVSQAIDRKMVSKLGEYGYGPPTTALGIEPLYPNWIDPSLKAKAKLLATYDPAAARKTFTDAGFTYKSGDLVDPKGDKVKFQMHVIGGWSDWVSSLQIVSRNLQAVGIDASVKIEPDWAAWVSNSAVNGNAPSLIWSNGAGDPTPYAYFYSHFDPSQVVPTGEDALALGNFERHSDAAAAALLRQFKGTLDVKKQKQVAYKLEAIFLDKLPFIPLFIGRAGRRTARSTSRGGSPGRTSTPIRSSRRSSRSRSRSSRSTTRTRSGSTRCRPSHRNARPEGRGPGLGAHAGAPKSLDRWRIQGRKERLKPPCVSSVADCCSTSSPSSSRLR